MGPVQLVPGRGMDVRPHPHIGLATVTYLFDGRVTHRDSEGNDMDITPGAMNLMTAGRGISHSERTPASVRSTGGGMFGIQSWIALPQDREEMVPLFEHFDAGLLPEVKDNGVRARVIAGSAFGRNSPVGMVSEWFYVEVQLDADASAPLDANHEERAIYVTEGEVEIAGDKFEAPQLLVFRPGDRITVKAIRPSRLMFLGGSALEGPRYLLWNFVSSRKERIEQAKEEWKSGKFALIPGDDKEFIPLPDK
jgi:redox-sensitive bicupin YhaK (pirin superfamily)